MRIIKIYGRQKIHQLEFTINEKEKSPAAIKNILIEKHYTE